MNNIVDNNEQYGPHSIVQSCLQQLAVFCHVLFRPCCINISSKSGEDLPNIEDFQFIYSNDSDCNNLSLAIIHQGMCLPYTGCIKEKVIVLQSVLGLQKQSIVGHSNCLWEKWKILMHSLGHKF